MILLILTISKIRMYTVHSPRTKDISRGEEMKGQDILILLKLISLEHQVISVQKQNDSSFLKIHSDSSTQEITRYNKPTSSAVKGLHVPPEKERDNSNVQADNIMAEENEWEGWQADDDEQSLELISDSFTSPQISNYYSSRSLSATLGVSKTEVHNSINRSLSVGLAYCDRNTTHLRVNKKILLNIIIHAIKYVFPATVSSMTRGIPTSFSSPALQKYVETAGDLIYVWPDPRGKKMGQSVLPLFSSVPFAVRRDKLLYEYLALIDAIRLGNAREVNLAKLQLEKGLTP